jgi:outer membrane receptor protein involved in Fe transport
MNKTEVLKMLRRILNLSLIIVLLLIPLSTFASVYGILKGKVVDQDGKPVIGATVRVQGTTLGAAVRNKDGSFTVVNISAGSYDVLVRAVGKKEVVKKVRISADETTEINIVLQDESVMGETITVTADRKAMVSKDAVGKQTTYSGSEVTGTSAEGVTAIVGLSAGVRNAGDGFNVRGMRSSETQIRVDGLDVGNQFTGGMGFGGTGYYPMVSAFGTEEVQVLTGGFSAEYGQAQGGVVNNIVKTGRTDRYEGLLRYRTDVPSLYGRQAFGLDLQRQDTRFVPVQAGEGAKLQGGQENTIDFGIGGPMQLPFLKNSTFYLSTYIFNEKYRGNSYEIYDPAGNNIGLIDHQGTWVKNITFRMRFAITDNIGLILGTQYGVTSAEFGSWGWLYATNPGILNGQSNGVPENLAKLPVGNQIVNNFIARINHTLSSSSFYEFTLSKNTNNDVSGRRDIDQTSHQINTSGPDFFSGFKILEPHDQYVIDGDSLIKARFKDGRVVGDKILDEFTGLSGEGYTADGYLKTDIPKRNPLTGYYEGQGYNGGTNNPYGLSGIFATSGTATGVSFRYGSYWQADGHYTDAFSTGDFSHIFKTGFQLRLYTLEYHYNGAPYDGNPFYDIYTDRFGGNIYAENQKVWDKTSKPNEPRELGYYIQDQISYKGIIISPGLRLDLVDPNQDYRVASKTFIPITSDTGFVKASVKYQVSPRINIAYPITDRSILSIAYGLYFKTPQYQYMYDNFAQDILRGGSPVGNPNLDAQRTNAYQVAYNQQFSDVFALGVTAYYNDLYSQLGATYIPASPTPFYIYSTSEYGNTRGVEFELRKQPAGDHLLVVLNYTYSKVDGTSPDPSSNFGAPRDIYTDKFAFPLAAYPQPWDLRHSFKGYVNFIWGRDEGPSIFGMKILQNANINFTGSYRSGYPYTKTDKDGKLLGEYNAERQPSFWTVSSRISKLFYLKDIVGESLGNTAVEFFVDIYNLFNRTVPTAVYSATGDPIDNGVTLNRRIGDFSSTTWFKDASYDNPASFMSDQYDKFGNRFYNVNSDFDKNGVVTQSEKFESYMKYVKTALSFLGNYSAPRTIYAGFMIRFN